MKPIFITAFFLLISYFSIGQNPIFSADAYRNDTIQQFPVDCNVLTLKLSTQAFSFCLKSKTLRYSYEVDLNNNGTIDLKGSLPYVFIKKSDGLKFGTHKIYWTVKDVCGNSSKLSKLFTVVDAKKPTVVTKILDFADTNCHIKVPATAFNNFTWDNCTPMNKLKFKIARKEELYTKMTLDKVLALKDTLEYDISYTNPNNVVLFAIDEDNNWDYAETYFTSNCKITFDSLNRYIVAKNELGQIIKNYRIKVNNFYYSTSNGLFDLPKLNVETNVSPFKTDNILNGLNALDVSILNEHIINGIPVFNKNRKFAADLNFDNKISTADLLDLRKSILNNKFYNTPWIFFNVLYGDPLQLKECKIDPLKPFLTDTFCLANNYLKYLPNQTLIDTTIFLGIKIGDLDLSSNPDSLLTIEERATEKSVIKLENVEFQSNELKTISLPFNSLASAKAYQGTLHFDTQKFEFVDVVGMDQEQYSLGDIENGNITFLNAANLYKPLVNIQLMLKAKQNCYLAEGLSFSSNPLVSEVYWTDKQWSKLEMQFENKTALLLQNTPNPFSNTTSIPFVLPSQQEVRFDFYDVNGSLIKSMTQDYSAGYQQLTIDENELKTSGMIYYQMITKDNIQTKNMILIKK